MTPTLLIVIGDLDLGGTERHLVQILPRLAARRYRVLVYTLSHKGRLAPALEAAGVTVIAPTGLETIRARSGRLVRRTLLGALSFVQLWRLLRRERPDIVHFFLPEAYLIGAPCAMLAGSRLRIMSRRSLNIYQQRYALAHLFECWLHRGSRALLGNSRAVVGELRAEGAPPERLGLIYNGVDPTIFDRPRAAARADLHLAEDALVFVIVANLIPYKGHSDLLAALGGVRESLPEGWRLLCVGRDDGTGDLLARQADRLGIAENLRWLGQRDDVATILGAADIGVLCSHQEGFSNSLLEGMAAGLAMVATDVGGNPEAVVDGVTGLLVPAYRPETLGAVLLALANDPERRRAMGAAGRRRATENFSIDACMARYERLYSGLIGGDGRSVEQMLNGGTRS